MTAGCRLAAASFLAALLWSGSAQAAPDNRPELFLTWNAPYGKPGAKTELDRACGDSTGADTLYMSFRLKDPEPVFSGLTGIVFFHAQLAESLATPWTTDSQKPPFLQVEFAQDTSGFFNGAWPTRGFGDWRYYPEPTRGIVRMLYAVPSIHSQPIVADRVFCFARIIVSRAMGDACEDALCVEWMESKFSFSINDRDALGLEGRTNFVTVNSPAGLACAKYRLLAERREAEREERVAPRPAPSHTHDH